MKQLENVLHNKLIIPNEGLENLEVVELVFSISQKKHLGKTVFKTKYKNVRFCLGDDGLRSLISALQEIEKEFFLVEKP